MTTMRLIWMLAFSILSCGGEAPHVRDESTFIMPRETHFRGLRQLTREGENSAEAYLSFDEKRIIFQSTRPPFACDQIFTMHEDGSDTRLVSTGKGRTTCGYFFADGKSILYSSTHLGADSCP